MCVNSGGNRNCIKTAAYVFFSFMFMFPFQLKLKLHSDPYSVLVNTGNSPNAKKRFTEFNHFDAASIMIIGDKIAHALATLLPSSLSAGPS